MDAFFFSVSVDEIIIFNFMLQSQIFLDLSLSSKNQIFSPFV